MGLVKDIQGLWALPAALSMALLKVGVRLTIEVVTDVAKGLEEGLLNLDLLGFDAVNMGRIVDNAGWMPTLNYNRLYESLAFAKQDYAREERTLGRPTVLALSLARYRALYLMGGWSIPGLDLLIRLRCQTIIEDIGEDVILTPQEKIDLIRKIGGLGIEVVNDDADEMLIEIANVTGVLSVPHLADIYELATGLIAPEEMQMHRYGRWAATFEQAPAMTSVAGVTFKPRPATAVRAEADELHVSASRFFIIAIRRMLETMHGQHIGIGSATDDKATQGRNAHDIYAHISRVYGIPYDGLMAAGKGIVQPAPQMMLQRTDLTFADPITFARRLISTLRLSPEEFKAAFIPLHEEFIATGMLSTFVRNHNSEIPNVLLANLPPEDLPTAL